MAIPLIPQSSIIARAIKLIVTELFLDEDHAILLNVNASTSLGSSYGKQHQPHQPAVFVT